MLNHPSSKQATKKETPPTSEKKPKQDYKELLPKGQMITSGSPSKKDKKERLDAVIDDDLEGVQEGGDEGTEERKNKEGLIITKKLE